MANSDVSGVAVAVPAGRHCLPPVVSVVLIEAKAQAVEVVGSDDLPSSSPTLLWVRFVYPEPMLPELATSLDGGFFQISFLLAGTSKSPKLKPTVGASAAIFGCEATSVGRVIADSPLTTRFCGGTTNCEGDETRAGACSLGRE